MPQTITSSLFGEIAIEKDKMYHFPNGIPGFQDQQKFLFIEVEESPFTVMHSCKEDLYFFLVDPFRAVPGYEFKIPDSVIEQLEIRSNESVVCYSIVVIREPFGESTANLLAPVIINTENHKGIQLVLENTRYSIRHRLFSEENNNHSLASEFASEQADAAANE